VEEEGDAMHEDETQVEPDEPVDDEDRETPVPSDDVEAHIWRAQT
jgi:hypothetical protein